MVLLSSAIKSVPEDTIEAGRIDGAGERRIFFNIIVPQIWPTVVTVFITVLIGVMKVFDVVYVTTNGAYNTDVIANMMDKEMFNNANFLRGDGSYSEYFDAGGIAAMLALPQNTDIQDVRVASTTVVDSNTSTVNVTMTWAGHHVVRAYTVHKDLTRVHYNFYYSWRIDIPFASINLTLPNQPGSIAVDGLTLPQGAVKDIQVVQGFHKVTMGSSDIYDNASMDADAIDSGPSVVVPGTISAAAIATAKKTVQQGFNNCKTIVYQCLNKVYNAPSTPGFIYYFTLPGYGDVPYLTYKYTLTRDPTTGMKVVVDAADGKLLVSGTCAYTMTIDGSKQYLLKGSWKGTLTVVSGGWGYDLLTDCVKSKG